MPKKKKSNNSWCKWLVVCVIPNETFTSGELSQLQAPDPSFVQGWNLAFYIKLIQPPLNKNSFCLNFSWHHQQQNSSFRLIKAKIQTAPENWKSRKAHGHFPFNGCKGGNRVSSTSKDTLLFPKRQLHVNLNHQGQYSLWKSDPW